MAGVGLHFPCRSPENSKKDFLPSFSKLNSHLRQNGILLIYYRFDAISAHPPTHLSRTNNDIGHFQRKKPCYRFHLNFYHIVHVTKL